MMNIAIHCDNYKLQLFKSALDKEGFVYSVEDLPENTAFYGKEIKVWCEAWDMQRLTQTLNGVEEKIRCN